MSNLSLKILKLLSKKKLTVSFAESCTGGLLASSITSNSGSSKVFNMGLVTYSNNAKVKLLQVPKKTITKYGAVSYETCLSMVKNLSKIYSKNNSEPVNALNNLNLDVKQGEIFGLLGPNGAGKSTFINILGGTVIKSKGTVNVWGYDLDKDPRQVRASLGIVLSLIHI